MFENVIKFFKKLTKTQERTATGSKDTAKERLHLVLMQDRANMSADFLELMKQEIMEVIKKYIDVDEELIDVRLTNKPEEDGSNGSPFLYANIPILNIKNDVNKEKIKESNSKEIEKTEVVPESEKVKKEEKKKAEKQEEVIESEQPEEKETSKVEEAKIEEEVKKAEPTEEVEEIIEEESEVVSESEEKLEELAEKPAEEVAEETPVVEETAKEDEETASGDEKKHIANVVIDSGNYKSKKKSRKKNRKNNK